MEEKLFYATGKRKNAIARINLKEGRGLFTINRQPIDSYFKQQVLKMVINLPFKLVDLPMTNFDISVNVLGGGLNGQAGAIKHGLSKILVEYNPEFRAAIKDEGFLTRDSRIKERKKYGQRGARARFQFSKR
jgi:small subunit ribosomal protein S9